MVVILLWNGSTVIPTVRLTPLQALILLTAVAAITNMSNPVISKSRPILRIPSTQPDSYSSSDSDSNDSEDPASLNDSSDEKFPFLQYGKPKPDNIYGREEDSQTAALLEQFRVARETSSLKGTFSSPYLYFSTILCS